MRFLIVVLVFTVGMLVPDNATARFSLLGLKNSLVQFALDRINVPGSLVITVEGVEEDKEGATDLVGLAVADGDGVWLRAERISMGWVPSRLLKGELAITKLVASNVQVLRAPNPGPEEKPPEDEESGPVEIKWPRAPLTVVVVGLRLNGVTVASGVIGDQPVAFDAEGSLRDEGDQQTATFNLTRTDEVAGQIRLDYQRDFEAETLRLSLDANEAPGGLVASLAGLPPESAAEVHIAGDGPVLDWQGDLRADIGNLGRMNGQITVPSVQPAEVRLDVQATAQGELQAAAKPLLDEPVNLNLDVLAEPDGLVTLHRLDVQGDLGSVSAKGSFDANAGNVDLAVDATLPHIGEPLLPGATAQDIGFKGTVSGLVDALDVSGKLQIANIESPDARVADLAVQADAHLSPETVDFTVTGNAAEITADKLELTEGAPVTLDIAGQLKGNSLTLQKAEVNGPLLHANAEGKADLAGGPVALTYRAEAGDLTPIAAAYGANAGGAFIVEGEISGALAKPTVEGTASLRQLMLDGQPVGDVELQHDVALGQTIEGTAQVRASTEPYGKVSADTAFQLDGNQLTITKLQANGLSVNASSDGTVTVDLEKTLIDGRLQWKADSLEPVGRVADVPLAGSSTGKLRLRPLEEKQAADLTANISGLRSGEMTAQSINLEAAVRDAFAEAPGLRADVSAQAVAAGGVDLPKLALSANGTLAALDLTATAAGTAPDGKEIAADLAARLGLAGSVQTIRVSRLDAQYGPEQARLASPLNLRIEGAVISAKGLDLDVPSGKVTGDVTLDGSRLRGNAAVTLADLGRWAELADLPVKGGKLNATAEFDTKRSATLNMSIRDLATDELPPGASGLNADIAADWNGREAVATATVTGGFGEPLKANARMALRPSSGLLPVPNKNAPLEGAVEWAGDLDALWAMVPAPDHYLQGKADVDLKIGGTVSEPTVAGKIELTDGRYENLETGTILADLRASSEVAADGSFVVTVAGNDGSNAPVNARIAVAGDNLNARIQTKRATLVRRPDVEAAMTANITATGPLLGPTVAGEILVDRAEVRLVNAMPPSIATLGDVRIKGAPAPRKKPPTDSPIELDLRVHAPGNIFVRGRGLDSEWKMDLEVGGNSSKPRVTGSIEKVRGQLVLVGREFELDTGNIFFSGVTPINPDIDVKLLRETDGIRGGIAVTGRASDIDVSFVSTPSLPQGEVMPRLLFGRSRQSLTAFEAIQLASGIAILLDGSGGTVDQVRSAVGLDVLRLEDDDDGTGITVGKNVADGVFVGATQPLDGSGPKAKVEIEVFENLAVETEVGSQGSASVGVKWKRDF